MIPDFEKGLKDKMDQASLKDLMPDFDKEQEWQQLSQQLQPTAKKKSMQVWRYAAALLVLVSVAVTIWYLSPTTAPIAARKNTPSPKQDQPLTVAHYDTPKVSPTENPHQPKRVAEKKQLAVKKEPGSIRKFSPDGVIYNGTPCPIELSINQTMNCPNKKPKAISSCSKLEPDQSGQLNYKGDNTIAKNCSLTVKEIEIKSVATGEVIILNSSSTPFTAQEVFSYITREKNGDVIAGVFNYDCDKKTRKHSLKLDNRDGNLILE